MSDVRTQKRLLAIEAKLERLLELLDNAKPAVAKTEKKTVKKEAK